MKASRKWTLFADCRSGISYANETISDIIDTEPSSGDVNKMLLGSFVEEYDEDDEDGTRNWMSPSRLMESPRATFRPLSGSARTSPSGAISPQSQGPELGFPIINTHTPPTRQQTRESGLPRSPNDGRQDHLANPFTTYYPRHEAP
jgi:hypothetical protein